jgi:hypothetical protein
LFKASVVALPIFGAALLAPCAVRAEPTPDRHLPTRSIASPIAAPSVIPEQWLRVPIAKAMAAIPNDDFSSYALGPIAGQDTWYAPSANSDAQVITTDGTNKALRIYANATAGFDYAAARTYPATAGIFSADIVFPALDVSFIFSPFSDTGPVSGFLTPHLTLAVDSSRFGQVYQRYSTTDGAYVQLNTSFAEGTVARVSWDVRADGTVALYRDGRLLFIGPSESAIYEGSARPIGSFLVGRSNGVARRDTGTRNVMTIDNIGGTLPTPPADTAPDLALIASAGAGNLGQTIIGRTEISPGGSGALALFVINASNLPASEVRLGGILPDGYSISSTDCPVTQTGVNWDTANFDLAANASRTCRMRLALASSVPSNDSWGIPISVFQSADDPYSDNNVSWTNVSAGVFGNGFE